MCLGSYWKEATVSGNHEEEASSHEATNLEVALAPQPNDTSPITNEFNSWSIEGTQRYTKMPDFLMKRW